MVHYIFHHRHGSRVPRLIKAHNVQERIFPRAQLHRLSCSTIAHTITKTQFTTLCNTTTLHEHHPLSSSTNMDRPTILYTTHVLLAMWFEYAELYFSTLEDLKDYIYHTYHSQYPNPSPIKRAESTTTSAQQYSEEGADDQQHPSESPDSLLTTYIRALLILLCPLSTLLPSFRAKFHQSSFLSASSSSPS